MRFRAHFVAVAAVVLQLLVTPPGFSQQQPASPIPPAPAPAQATPPAAEATQVPDRHAEIEKKIDELSRAQKKLGESEARFDFLANLLGLASFALLIFSLILGLVAFLGWKHLEDLQDRRIGEAVKSVERVASARISAGVGFILGRLARNEGDYLKAQRDDLVEAAIPFLERAVDELTSASSDYQWNAMNNLAFNYAVSGRRMYATKAVSLARQLKQRTLDTGQNPEFLTTYVRVVGEFLDTVSDPPEAYRDLQEILMDIRTSRRSRVNEVREAEQYSRWLRSRKP